MSVNKAILIGNLGADPEVRYAQSGTAMCTVSIATNESWKDKQTGERQDRTEWHRVVFFTRLAEIVGEYLKKGSKIYVEGRLQTRKWQDKDGNDRWTTEIIAGEMKMLDRKGEVSGGDEYDQRQSQPPARGGHDGGGGGGGGGGDRNTGGGATDFDDDIPF